MNRELTYNKWIKYIHDYQLNKNKMERKTIKDGDGLLFLDDYNDMKEARDYFMEKYNYLFARNKVELQKTEQVLEWMHLFVDYIQEQDPKLYNKACEYADSKEEKTPPLLYSELNKIK